MDDRELIIDALRDYERKAEHCAKLAKQSHGENGEGDPELAALWQGRAEDALRVRAELEDNADFIVKGGGA